MDKKYKVRIKSVYNPDYSVVVTLTRNGININDVYDKVNKDIGTLFPKNTIILSIALMKAE